MAANLSKIDTLASPEASHSNKDSKELSDVTSNKIELEISKPDAVAPSLLFAHNSSINEITSLKKWTSENVLTHVFRADPDGIAKLSRTFKVHPKIFLIETSFAEGYTSRELAKFICFRRYDRVSALVAAYRCGDFKLGRKILASLLRDNTLSNNEKESLLATAREQLIELSKRITPSLNAGTVTTDTSAATTLAITSTSAAATTTASTPTAPAATAQRLSPGDTTSTKERTELNSVPAARMDEFADSDEFLSAIVELINAYKTYIFQYNSLSLEQQNKMEVTLPLWLEVGKCQKRLYHYVFLEFFSPIPFEPLPAFNAEPPRGPCVYHNRDFLNLDMLGFTGILHQLRYFSGAIECAIAPPPSLVQPDLEAISHLYRVRVNDLRNTIVHLQSLGSALSFLKDETPFLNNTSPALRINP